MTKVENSFATLTTVEDWSRSGAEPQPHYTVPALEPGRLVRFWQALGASMALLRRPSFTRNRQPVVQHSTDILAQNYPHLYLHVMCG